MSHGHLRMKIDLFLTEIKDELQSFVEYVTYILNRA